MNDQIKTFDNVLNKYKLKTDVNPDIQKFIIESRKRNLNKVLKRVGKFGLLYWFVILTNMTFKKFGINLSILQSKIIFGVTTVVVTATSTTGVYQSAKYVYKTYVKPEVKQIEKVDPLEKIEIEIPDQIEIENKKTEIKKTVPQKIEIYKFGIQNFKSDITNTDQTVSQIIYNELVRLNGKKSIAWSGTKNTKFNNIISGSCRKIGNSYQLTAKVIDSKNYKVKVMLSENIKDENEIKNACKKIATEISKQIK